MSLQTKLILFFFVTEVLKIRLPFSLEGRERGNKNKNKDKNKQKTIAIQVF